MIRAISFLQRQPDSGVLYFRRRIPERYRRAFGGRSEVKRSLRTCDKKIAAPRAMALYAELQTIFNELDKVIEVADDNGFSKIEFNETVHPDGRVERKADIDFDGDSEKEMAALVQVKEMFSRTPEQKPDVAIDVPVSSHNGAVSEPEKLSVVCGRYRDEMMQGGNWTSKTAAEQEATHELLIQFFGDVQIATITSPQARKLYPENSSLFGWAVDND